MTSHDRKYALLQAENMRLRTLIEELEAERDMLSDAGSRLRREVWSYQRKNAWLKDELNRAERELEKGKN